MMNKSINSTQAIEVFFQQVEQCIQYAINPQQWHLWPNKFVRQPNMQSEHQASILMLAKTGANKGR
jgi:hypothetical protein